MFLKRTEDFFRFFINPLDKIAKSHNQLFYCFKGITNWKFQAFVNRITVCFPYLISQISRYP
jgi:two-component sensor histidine kinase